MLLRWASLLCLVVPGSWSAPLPDNQFQTLSYDTIVTQLHELSTNYPHLAQVYSAQERYHLPSPGACSTDGSVECEQWVLHISDHNSLGADPERPEVFLSGCLHGDEQVGPTAVMEAAKLMVYAAVCEADSAAEECNDEVLEASPEMVPWLARLALTRSTVIMPMTNSIGYYNTVRAENGLDPNRDFPYHQEPDKCMTTITARAVNEVWREHAFQLAVTFHGGMVGMAYEWGSPDHPHKKDPSGNWQDTSPDDLAQTELTGGLSLFAGGFKEGGKTFEAYPTGRMNELVYPVAGGMEDWAYAGSWGAAMGVCEPTTNGGYPKEKTIYNSATLRALNILVEASDNKHPPQPLLGSRQGLLDRTPSLAEHGNGHVARNVRLTLMVLDLVEPYVQWGALAGEKEPVSDARVVVADEKLGVDLEWTVGGAFEVGTTQLVWGPWPESSDTLTRQDWEAIAGAATDRNRSPAQAGRSRWSSGSSKEGGERETTFRERFDLEQATPGGVKLQVHVGEGGGEDGGKGDGAGAAFVVAVASVDQAWGAQLAKGSPDVGPQSHYVNARTSEDWFEENNGHVVRGRLEWLSAPLKVIPPRTATAAPSRPAATAKPPVPDSVDAEALSKETRGVQQDREDLTAQSEVPGGDVSKGDTPSGASEEGATATATAPVVLGIAAVAVLVLAATRAWAPRRLGGAAGVAVSRRARGLRGAGGSSSQLRAREHHPETVNNSTAGDVLNRRRHQETTTPPSHGVSSSSSSNNGSASSSVPLERRGLLSPINETP